GGGVGWALARGVTTERPPPPLVLVPAGADAHLDPPAGHDVDGGRDLRQVRGIAVPHACAHLPEAYPLRRSRERRHQRPGLVGCLIGGYRNGVEMVVDPDRFEGSGIGGLGQVAHRCPLVGGSNSRQGEAPRLGDEESKAHCLILLSDVCERMRPGAGPASWKLTWLGSRQRMPGASRIWCQLCSLWSRTRSTQRPTTSPNRPRDRRAGC